MASEGFDVTGIDVNEHIIKLAKELEREYFGERKVKYIKMSMFELDFQEQEFDLAYSVGVLEHFDDNMIMNTIKQQLRIAKKVIIVIPTKWFDDDETLHGDDRFLTLKHWRNMINKSGGKVIKEYSYPFKQKYYQKIKNIRKIFRPKAYRVFLIEER